MLGAWKKSGAAEGGGLEQPPPGKMREGLEQPSRQPHRSGHQQDRHGHQRPGGEHAQGLVEVEHFNR